MPDALESAGELPAVGRPPRRAVLPKVAVEEHFNYLTARAAGNPNAKPGQSAGHLGAGGLGSTTFRPTQAVTARAAWKDGRWVVVLRRPLDLKAEDGLPLAPGAKCSIAFALWDGAVRDRGGQKLVSIWHDLKLD